MAKSSTTVVGTGSVTKRWKQVAAWLAQAHPEALAQFRAPATEKSIAAAEAALGVELPADYKAFLALHDGQEEGPAPWVGLGWLLPIAKVLRAHADIVGATDALDDDDNQIPRGAAGRGIRSVFYSKRWIPISQSPRGREFLCIDLDPAPGGKRGQILEYVGDSDSRPLVSRSFAELVSLYFERAQRGEIDFDRYRSASTAPSKKKPSKPSSASSTRRPAR